MLEITLAASTGGRFLSLVLAPLRLRQQRLDQLPRPSLSNWNRFLLMREVNQPFVSFTSLLREAEPIYEHALDLGPRRSVRPRCHLC
jgi:hypothetical protein